jgi:hypothetical protein
MRCYVLIVFAILNAGCALVSEKMVGTDDLKLPSSNSLPCCWQAVEQLELDYVGHQFSLTAATAVLESGLTVVIFDPLGRRLYTIVQKDNAYSVEKDVDVPTNLPVSWLLLGVFLREMPIVGWDFLHSNWTFINEGNQQVLMRDNRPSIRLLVEDNSVEQQAKPVWVQYEEINLKLKIMTLSRQSL